ncbi:MAG: uncharacterized protein QOD39_1319, partial [Mycobacterium sp.]|nr:uncharacterized protein [Mycobacterium sp.]
ATAADGSTALQWAVFRDDTVAADLLIKAGASVSAPNRYGVSPLIHAATNGNAAMIDRLLTAGADPNTATPAGQSALMTAARVGNAGAVNALLARHADVIARESTRGQTALMWAAAEGNSDAVRALIAAGAEVNARATGPQVVKNEKPDANTSGLLLFLGVKSRRLDTLTPLMFAARRGQLDTARVLLAAGGKVNDATADGTTPLALAIANAHWDMASALIDGGADPNAAQEGWTALHLLARTRKPNLGYVPGVQPSGTVTSLEVAEKLIAKGANVNARQEKPVDDSYRQGQRIGATPFWLAAKYVDVELMKVLLRHGADPALDTKNHTTALMAATGLDMMYLSEDTGTDEDTLEAVRLCLDRVDVNAVNDNGDTALHGASRRGLNSVVQLLVDHGAALDKKNKKALSPFGVAAGAQRGDRQPQTAALLQELMVKKGLPIERIDLETTQDPLKRPATVRQ